jgi:serine/threonine-protein kinase
MKGRRRMGGRLELRGDEILRTQAGDFALMRRLGQGGMGTVFLATEKNLNRSVVLKVPAPEVSDKPDYLRALEYEARVLANLDHESLVRVLGQSWTADERRIPLYWMDYLHGEPLSETLRREKVLPALAAVGIAKELSEGLRVMAKAQVVHCDIKPSNVFLARKRGRDWPKLIDFGCGYLMLDPSMDVVGGTPLYAAPEQIEMRRLSPAADVFALGAVLFQMLTGETPYHGIPNDWNAHRARVRRPAPSLSAFGAFPPSLVALVAEMLALDPAARPSDTLPSRLGDVHRELVARRARSGGADPDSSQKLRVTQVREPESQKAITPATVAAPTEPGTDLPSDFLRLRETTPEPEKADTLVPETPPRASVDVPMAHAATEQARAFGAPSVTRAPQRPPPAAHRAAPVYVDAGSARRVRDAIAKLEELERAPIDRSMEERRAAAKAQRRAARRRAELGRLALFALLGAGVGLVIVAVLWLVLR